MPGCESFKTDRIRAMPNRIQYKPSRDGKLPDDCVLVGGSSPWRNHWKVIKVKHRKTWCVIHKNGAFIPFEDRMVALRQAVEFYRVAVENNPETVATIKEKLKGKDLADYLPLDEPSHADVLLEIANS